MILLQKETSDGLVLVSQSAGITGLVPSPTTCLMKTVLESSPPSGMTSSAMSMYTILCVNHHHKQSRGS